ncbi:family 78 glycoside hydrolase catalytic domain [Actinoplanes sp. URMC 104]|uniref:family 78 glycoside hydrolase catalytic domain n=1 Tax=Actinoplanes sp. URMC 104 TaxID=3423409 RepID=UPI003F19BD85
MSPIRRPVILTTTALLLTLGAAVPAQAHSGSAGGVRVTRLSVDGRYDSPLGLDNVRPTLAWQMTQTGDCRQRVCAADRQTAYEVQAASTVAELHAGRLLWRTGKVAGDNQQVRFGRDLRSRDTVAWRVRVWDANRKASAWSAASTWTTGLLNQADWGTARWIDYPDRAENQPMPIFARQFAVPRSRKVADARLYLSGVGLHHATVNGREITDEVLAPGNSNYQLSSEYRTYDLTSALRSGANAVGVELGNGPAYVRRSVTNPAVGRTSPYSWWQSQLKGNGTLTADAPAGATSIAVSDTAGYHVGGTVNVDTGGGGDRLESRVITAVSTGTIAFTPGLTGAHEAGAKVTGSGNNIAASDASAGAAVTPRFIGRLEIRYRDGSRETIVTDRSWRTALGPLVTDAWYSGSDYDARREQPGWNTPGADLGASAKRRDGTATGWIAAGIAPPPNLATKLVARTAEPITVQETFKPVSVTNPAPGTWVFDFGQNIVGWPLLRANELPAGTTVKMQPAESLNPDGTVNQASLMGGGGSRGVDLFNTYTAAGGRTETWHPNFNYFGMQWVQVSGLPAGFTPTKDLITGVRLQADTPIAGTFSSSNARVNRVHTMSRYSFASNIMSVFTDCPGREKLSYPADYTMPMGAIHRDFQLNAFMKTTMRHLVEGQSIADTPMAGNVALKTPVYDWGYSGRFGDEINWGNAIVLVPAILHQLYGDTATMSASYDRLVRFVDYIQRQKVVDGYYVDAALADWVSAEPVSGRITGTWGYYLTIQSMARIAALTGHTADASRYAALAEEIKAAFNRAFFDASAGRYAGPQTAQALALDAGLVPAGSEGKVLDALVEQIYAFHPNGTGPHFSGGTIGMGPIVRALMNGDRDDVLWDALQQNDEPSYGYFMESTPANPGGMTTIGERWNRGDSKNHMILAQIEEWFHAGIAGIQAAPGSVAYDRLVFKPKPVGDLTKASGSYETPAGSARSAWTKTGNHFALSVTVPANTQAEVWVPATDKRLVDASSRAVFQSSQGAYVVYTVSSGSHTFTARSAS